LSAAEGFILGRTLEQPNDVWYCEVCGNLQHKASALEKCNVCGAHREEANTESLQKHDGETALSNMDAATTAVTDSIVHQSVRVFRETTDVWDKSEPEVWHCPNSECGAINMITTAPDKCAVCDSNRDGDGAMQIPVPLDEPPRNFMGRNMDSKYLNVAVQLFSWDHDDVGRKNVRIFVPA
jgi:rubrerythrin